MRRLSYAGACASPRTGCMVGLVRRRSIDAPGGWQTSVTPQPETTYGTLPLGRFIPMHPRRLCIWSCRYGRRILSEIIFLTLGPPLLPPRAVYARHMFSPLVRILGHADREHRWRHIEHLPFECQGILGAGGTLAVKLLRDDFFRACFGSDHASAVLLAAFPSDHTPVVAATACLVPFLLDPAAALGRPPPLAHEVAMPGSGRDVLAWCAICGVHEAASV